MYGRAVVCTTCGGGGVCMVAVVCTTCGGGVCMVAVVCTTCGVLHGAILYLLE